MGENGGFSWKDLGDIDAGRPNLGLKVPVAMYRLLLFTLRDAISSSYDDETARRMLVEAGKLAGREYCRHILDREPEMGRFLAGLQKSLKEWGIGLPDDCPEVRLETQASSDRRGPRQLQKPEPRRADRRGIECLVELGDDGDAWRDSSRAWIGAGVDQVWSADIGSSDL